MLVAVERRKSVDSSHVSDALTRGPVPIHAVNDFHCSDRAS